MYITPEHRLAFRLFIDALVDTCSSDDKIVAEGLAYLKTEACELTEAAFGLHEDDVALMIGDIKVIEEIKKMKYFSANIILEEV